MADGARRDRRLLYTAVFVRATTTSTVGVTLGPYLARPRGRVAPVVAGLLMVGDTLYVPLVVGAAMKITYDILLWRAFRAIRPPEET